MEDGLGAVGAIIILLFTTSVSSTVKSLLVWTVSRYGYEIRANGEVVATNVSGN